MKVCLVTGPRFDCKPGHKSLPPLGMAYLGAVARRGGHLVAAVDGVMVGRPGDIARQVAQSEPDVVGMTTTTSDRLACLAAIRQIRLAVPGAFLVVGGSHFSHSAVDALEAVPEIDAVVVGEGEETFSELLAHLPQRDGLEAIAGLVFRDADGQIVRNAPREVMRDINHLPMPAWDLFDVQRYDFHMIDTAATPIIGVMTTRGCPQSCVFCANSLNKKMRYLAPELAVDQIAQLQKSYGIVGLKLFDDDFLTNPRHAAAFCEEVLRRNCKINWACGARARNLDADLLKLMQRAGCTCISFGVETGTNEVLKASRKNLKTEEVLLAMELVGKLGFDQIELFLMIGLPGETTETIDRTVKFIHSLRPLLGAAWHTKTVLGQLPLVFPGTGLEVIGRQEGTFPERFSWNRPYLEPKRYLPLINRRFASTPHFENAALPLEKLCEHVGKHHWRELSRGRRSRYRLAPLRRLAVALGLA